MKSILLQCALMVVILATAIGTPIAAPRASAETEITPELLDALRTASFDLSSFGESLAAVTLDGGLWEGAPVQADTTITPTVRLYPDPSQPVMVVGDLTGDGTDELVAVLAIDAGGAGAVTALAVMAVDDGPSLAQLAVADLGARTQIEHIAVDAGQAIVDAVFVDEQDEVCYPGIAERLVVTLADGVLQIEPESGKPLPGAFTEGAGEDEATSYEELLADALTQVGVFTIHQPGDDWFLEIPTEMLGRPFYWYTEISRVPTGLSALGAGMDEVGAKMVAFERIGDTVVVNELSSTTAKRSDPGKDAALDRAVAESALPSVLLSLPILDESPAGALVVDFGGPLSFDLADFNVGNYYVQRGASAQFDPERSFVQEMDAYPNNIGVSSLLTFLVTPPWMTYDDLGREISPPADSQTVLVRHSMTLLPETPMRPRYFDSRVGYDSVFYEDYSGQQVPDVTWRTLITRFRLERQDPSAEISEPVQPIVFYISREVPARWRAFVKEGVEAWLPAFEAAGFKNAIVVKDAPSVEEDPNWDPADTRYSVIRWVAQPELNAEGPNTVDPRSGEILSAHVQLYADVLEMLERWYFAQASAVDERARRLPLPDEILGPALRQVVTHEVGHALGLLHNHKASQAFTIDQLRDPEFTSQHGTAPSIMSYGRFNYIAQPGDGVTALMPQLGPYDVFAIQWGYMPIAGADLPEDEVTTLDGWAARQIDEPWLRYGDDVQFNWWDPTVLAENLGDDRIEATRLGIANIERAMGYLVDATTSLGSDYSKTDTMYGTLLDQRYLWLASVVKLIGGVEETRTLAGRGDVQYQRVAKIRQQEALRFVLENLQTPAVFISADVIDRLRPEHGLERLQTGQAQLVWNLLEASRLERLSEGEQLGGADAYPLLEYLAALQTGLFAELQADAPAIDPLRRDVQRVYVDTLSMYTDGSHGGNLRSAARWTLQELLPELAAAAARSSDLSTRAHLVDLREHIQTMLGGAAIDGGGE